MPRLCLVSRAAAWAHLFLRSSAQTRGYMGVSLRLLPVPSAAGRHALRIVSDVVEISPAPRFPKWGYRSLPPHLPRNHLIIIYRSRRKLAQTYRIRCRLSACAIRSACLDRPSSKTHVTREITLRTHPPHSHRPRSPRRRPLPSAPLPSAPLRSLEHVSARFKADRSLTTRSS
ncbi:hypothetical protein DENSPDRAFT_233383 [Dentipellis sp. KUC8613]|nr:hypothetical protein DENSPDRAFT_233383 [Dentipellis sp. KUC8613]